MYRSFTADQHRKHMGFSSNYTVDAMLCYGTMYQDKLLTQLTTVASELGVTIQINDLPHPFLQFAREVRIGPINLWAAVGYGGAWLSEYLHWACLFGSKKNILVGKCGGLGAGMKQGDFIIPLSSYAEESSARLYNRESPNQPADTAMSELLSNRLLEKGHTVCRGPIVTCQAILGETLEDVKTWSSMNYVGVEMEASTVFAVSNHFGVPSGAMLFVTDNLVAGHTNFNEEYVLEADKRRQNELTQMKVALAELIR